MSDISEQEKFLRVSLRHLAAIRGAQVAASGPFPQGWFDLPERQLTDLGAMTWLASFSRYHMHRSLAEIQSSLDIPLRLSQYRILRSDGYPRAFFTWAGLDHDAETQFGVDHIPLRKEHWNSGSSLWVIDLVAPFGHLDQVIKVMAANRQTNRVRTLWHNKSGTRARVIEWTRATADSEIKVTSYGQNQFAHHLAAGN